MSEKINHRNSKSPFHLTARCINRQWFAIPMQEVWEVMEGQLFFVCHAYGMKVHAFVLMNNHWHMIARAPQANLGQAMGYFMRETSREISRRCGRVNQTYGRPYHKSALESPLYYLHAYKYLYRNPVKAGLARCVEEYEFSTLPGLLGWKRSVIPVAEDATLFNDVEATLKWLNRVPRQSHSEIVRKALKRAKFQMSSPRRHGYWHNLEEAPL